MHIDVPLFTFSEPSNQTNDASYNGRSKDEDVKKMDRFYAVKDVKWKLSTPHDVTTLPTNQRGKAVPGMQVMLSRYFYTRE